MKSKKVFISLQLDKLSFFLWGYYFILSLGVNPIKKIWHKIKIRNNLKVTNYAALFSNKINLGWKIEKKNCLYTLKPNIHSSLNLLKINSIQNPSQFLQIEIISKTTHK